MPPKQAEPVPDATEVAPLHVRLVGRATKFIEVLKSAAIVMTFFGGIFWWAWGALEVKAAEAFEEGVKEIIAPLLAEQNKKIDDALSIIVEGQSDQSDNEAIDLKAVLDSNQELKCLLLELKGETPGPECQ